RRVRQFSFFDDDKQTLPLEDFMKAGAKKSDSDLTKLSEQTAQRRRSRKGSMYGEDTRGRRRLQRRRRGRGRQLPGRRPRPGGAAGASDARGPPKVRKEGRPAGAVLRASRY